MTSLMANMGSFFVLFVSKRIPKIGGILVLYVKSQYGASRYILCSNMERNSVMRIVNVLRYNSPSKRQIRRLNGRPKWLNAKNAKPAPVAVEPIKYTSKTDAPFAVYHFDIQLIYR